MNVFDIFMHESLTWVSVLREPFFLFRRRDFFFWYNALYEKGQEFVLCF